MPVINSIAADKDEMTAWRRDFHEHPELAFEEVRTSGIVAEKLRSWGIEVTEGVAKTGVIGTLKGRNDSGRAIGLRADMDCLPMTEMTDIPWKSKTPGKMHACGHDGHTTMLLGAAKYLAETRNFDGTVHFIFQPAEEGGGGGRVMVEEGLFGRFPCNEVYGMHNWPALPAGTAGIIPGPVMAAADTFDLTIKAKGGHAAMPHTTIDPIVIGIQIVQAWQTLVSRGTDPLDSAVISTTQFHAGSAHNVIPETAKLNGTVRTLRQETRDRIEVAMGRMAEALCAGFGAVAEFKYNHGYPVTENHPEQTDKFAEIARQVLGQDKVQTDLDPVMGAEDFSYMLLQRPGAYLWLGQAGGHSDAQVHNPAYDFNDEVLPLGASLFAALVESELKAAG